MTYGKPIAELPLKPSVLHILLALSRGETHGLGIADAVERETAGQVRLGPGTLYRSLRDMADAGLVELLAAGSTEDPRRKTYRLTPAGLEVLRAEASRLEAIVDLARERSVLAGRT